MYLVPDFETVSQADLKKVGAWRYSEDITTEIICVRWSNEKGEQVGEWLPGQPFPFTKELADGTIFVAHNAAFEKAICRNILTTVYGWPDIPDKLWDCTLARCANLCVPQDLDGAIRVLRLPDLKDTEASKEVISWSKPDRKGHWKEITPEMVAFASEYCADDCRGQKGLRERVGTLSPAERQVWLLDQRINQRGFRIDLPLIDAMQKVVDEATVPMLAEFKAITGIPKLGSQKLLGWCADRGVTLPNLQKETITRLLKEQDDDTEDYDELAGEEIEADQIDIPEEVRRALHIKNLVGSAAVKKLVRAKQCVSLDGRVRGSLQYHGAGPGLWAGRLLQPHNFPRGTLTTSYGLDKNGIEINKAHPVEVKVDALMTGDYKYVEALVGPAVETVVSSLRHILVPSVGREFVVGDFAGIQARIALAGAGQHDKTALMAAGQDVYLDMASAIYGVPVLKNETERRQIGKNSVLGLGFQMGWRKFKLRYCREQPDTFAEGVVKTYRTEWAPEVPKLWYGLDEAALDTVKYRTPHEAYGVLYKLEDQWLTARLPSGRKLHYFNPQLIRKTMPWSDPQHPDVREAWTYQVMKTGRWKTVDAFGGLLTENFASGLARDLLVTAMFKCEKNNLPIVLTVHDEIISDAEKRVDNAEVLRQIMEDRPQWAIDMKLPVAAETWAGDRYKK